MRFLRIVFLTVLVVSAIHASAQDFEFGQFDYDALDMKVYSEDTAATAVVLREFGEAYIKDEDERNLVFKFHVKIKILKQSGLDEGNFQIPLFRGDGHEEKWISLQASTFNREGRSVSESRMDPSAFIIEKTNRNYYLAKFTLPNVRVGSVIEVKYVLESPFKFNFRSWQFQDDIPKVKSEYWVKIPGNRVYNITLKGFQDLSKNETTVIKDCFDLGGGARGDCIFSKYVMEDVPAFIEEEYMTSKYNYLSAILFELAELTRFDGGERFAHSVQKFAVEWKNIVDELRKDENFGAQVRKARNLNFEELKLKLAIETDNLKKATIIYEFIRNWYEWNERAWVYSSSADVKKAYELHKGNVCEINLTLVGALQAFDIEADPVISSTRDNGFPIEVHPVMTSFNYVVARVKIGDKSYLLDATDKFLPFGMLPERSLNGKGRVVNNDELDWILLKPSDKRKRIQTLDLKLMEDGTMHGNLAIQSLGYAAMTARKEMGSELNKEEYIKTLEKKWPDVKVSNFAVENFSDLTKPLVEKMEVTLANFDNTHGDIFYFNPFVLGRLEKNPFRSAERLYPVDYGVAADQTLVLTLQLPDDMKVEELPTNTSFALPQGGGKYLLNVNTMGNKVMLTNVFTISKAIYTSEEYHFLKEFYARIVQIQQSQFVFKKK